MIEENLDLFLMDFGVAASLNGGLGILVIFSNAYDPIAGLDADGRAILALGKASDLGTALQGDTLTVEATDYEITSVEPIQDGQFIRLRLMEL
jgi:hypothetical protein